MTLSDVIKVRMPKLWLLKVWMYNYKYKILYIALEIVSIHSMFIILFLLFVNQIDFLVPCPSDRLLPTTLIIVQGNKNYMNKVDFVSRTAQHIYYFHWILDGISRMSHTGMSHWKLETYSRSLDFIWRVILLFFFRFQSIKILQRKRLQYNSVGNNLFQFWTMIYFSLMKRLIDVISFGEISEILKEEKIFTIYCNVEMIDIFINN